MLPAVFTTAGLIAPEWQTVSDTGEVTEHSTSLYYMSSRYLLPAALVLMTLSIDLKSGIQSRLESLGHVFYRERSG